MHGVAQSWTRLSTHTAHGGLMEKRLTWGGRRHNPRSPSSRKPELGRPGKASLEGLQNPLTAEGLCTPCRSPSASSIVLPGERDWQAKSRGWETWPQRGALPPHGWGLGLFSEAPPAARPPHALLPAQPLPCRALLPVKPVPRQPSRFSLDSVAVGVPFRSPPTWPRAPRIFPQRGLAGP